ncbi:hypothetical protein ABBQ32_005788 [Trebouxia sp. C0010 RCD-2024]
MNRQNTSRSKRAGSLGDSASDCGKILSYQRMPQDTVKPVPADGTAELTSQAITSPARVKHRARVVTDPSGRTAFVTGRSELYSSSETSRSRLSSANLEQNHHAYRNHPQSLDSHERTRQWLKSSEISPVSASNHGVRKPAPSTGHQRHSQHGTQPAFKQCSGLWSMFACFRPETHELQASPVVGK